MSGKRRLIGRAPGRIDLMGGAGSYTGGLVLEATTAEAICATIGLRDDQQICLYNPQAREQRWDEQAQFSLAELSSDDRVRQLAKAAPEICWTAYALGAFFLLKEWFPDRVTCGANIYIKSEIPLRRGAGASAAMEVAVMKTAASAYGTELSGVELAAACQWVENVIAESPCGIVDQIAVVLGEEGQLLPLVCQPCAPQPSLRLPDELQLWGMASGADAPARADSEAARTRRSWLTS